MDLSANDVEMIFDDYANYYNDSGSSVEDHISVLAEFSSIGQALELHGKEIDSSLKESFSVLYYAFEYIFNEYLSKGFTREELTKVKIESIVEQLDEIVNKEGRLTSSFIKGEITEKEISILIDKVRYFLKSYVENPENLDIDTDISTIERELRMLKQVTPHMAAIGLLKRIIINGYYPSPIPTFSELSEDDKAKLRLNGNQVGAPLREDVPQDEIEQIVRDLLKKSERGVRVEASRDGKKMMFQVVHDNGKRKGRANINQILKYFEFAHPNLLAISDRQFVKRIKKAVPEGMK